MTQQYIGTKIIDAKPQEKDGKAGYFVRYEGGYESWSPKDTFEHAYARCNAMSFGHAYQAMVFGQVVTCGAWDGHPSQKDRILYMEKAGQSHQVPGHAPRMVIVELFYYNGKKTERDWMPNQADMMMDNWRIVK